MSGGGGWVGGGWRVVGRVEWGGGARVSALAGRGGVGPARGAAVVGPARRGGDFATRRPCCSTAATQGCNKGFEPNLLRMVLMMMMTVLMRITMVMIHDCLWMIVARR